MADLSRWEDWWLWCFFRVAVHAILISHLRLHPAAVITWHHYGTSVGFINTRFLNEVDCSDFGDDIRPPWGDCLFSSSRYIYSVNFDVERSLSAPESAIGAHISLSASYYYLLSTEWVDSAGDTLIKWIAPVRFYSSIRPALNIYLWLLSRWRYNTYCTNKYNSLAS